MLNEKTERRLSKAIVHCLGTPRILTRENGKIKAAWKLPDFEIHAEGCKLSWQLTIKYKDHSIELDAGKLSELFREDLSIVPDTKYDDMTRLFDFIAKNFK